MRNSVKCNSVMKSYDDETEALSGISLTISEGDFFGLMGRNGAGKTTLINILTGQIDPDEGDVDVMGSDPVESPTEVRSRIGILPEKESPMSFLTPREHFQFVAEVRGMSDTRLESQIEFWADKLELRSKLDSKNKSLSRGQQQKVMFASAFIHEPDLVFIDEPLVNLDPPVQRTLKEFLKDYNDDGNTIVLSTHYTEAAIELCEKISVVRDGIVVEETKTNDIESPRDIENIMKGDKE